MFRRRLGKAILAAGIAISAASTGSVALFAHGDAKGVVKERMEAMERFEELTERIFAMLHGELPYSADVVRKAAQEISAGAGAHLVKLFPKGSGGEPSEALPAVWQDMGTFEHFAEMLEVSAEAVEASANNKPEGETSLPKKWEDVPTMGQGMMGGGQGRGMMGGQGMMGGGQGMMGRGSGPAMAGDTVEGAVWRMAHVCNTCHEAFRKEE